MNIVDPTFDCIGVPNEGGCPLCGERWRDDNNGDGTVNVVDLHDGTGLWHSACFFSIYAVVGTTAEPAASDGPQA